MTRDCTFCGCDVDAHDPVFVASEGADEREGEGQFCNYGCLSAWIDAENKAVGTTCQFDPA